MKRRMLRGNAAHHAMRDASAQRGHATLTRMLTSRSVRYCKTCGGIVGQKTPVSGETVQDFPTGVIPDMGVLTKG